MSNPEKPADPFDPLSLRIDPSMGTELGVQKALLHVPIRKPNRQEYFRARPDAEYRMNVAIIELKEERETYVVAPDVAAALPGETRVVDLRLCVTRTGSMYLWAVPLPPPDGRENAWHKTAREAAEIAETKWVRMAANMGAGCYDVFTAPEALSAPRWPEESFPDLLRVAFGGGRLIDSIEHPVIKRLMGL
jgi:hypothetical protein